MDPVMVKEIDLIPSPVYYNRASADDDIQYYIDVQSPESEGDGGIVGSEEVRDERENITNTDGLFVVRKLHLVIVVAIHSIVMVALVAVGITTYHATKHGGTEDLTMGSKSSFSVAKPASKINYYLTFSRVIYNLGGDFNARTGLFFCTKPGVYVFSFSVVKKRNRHSRVDKVYCYLYKNNKYVMYGVVDLTNDTNIGHAYASHTVTIHLNVTDTAGLRYCSDPSTTMEYWTSFSGFLLYPD